MLQQLRGRTNNREEEAGIIHPSSFISMDYDPTSLPEKKSQINLHYGARANTSIYKSYI